MCIVQTGYLPQKAIREALKYAVLTGIIFEKCDMQLPVEKSFAE